MILSGLELNLSDRCNLACAFCYTRRNEGRGPDIERTKATIRWFMGASEAPKASISFFGGEPLVEWNDLQRAVEWGDAEFDRPIRWGIVTNMTLLDDSKLGWLVGHKVRISPSIDGDAAAQDTHRHYADGTGTSDAVFSAARRLLAARPGTSCRMTVSPTTVEHLADSVIFLCSEVGFRTVNSILAAGVDWPPEALDEVKRQTHRLTDWWIEQMRAGRHYSLYYLRNMLMGLSARERRRPLCHAGTGRMAVDTGGDIWPCHRFCNLDSRPEWRLGTLETGITNEDLQRRLREYDLAVALKDRCASCPAVLGCHAVCIHESMIAGAGPDEMIRPTPQMCAIWPHYWAEAMRAHAILTAERNRLYYGSYMRRADRRPARRPQKDDRAAKAHGGVDKCSRQPCREKMAAAVAAASANCEKCLAAGEEVKPLAECAVLSRLVRLILSKRARHLIRPDADMDRVRSALASLEELISADSARDALRDAVARRIAYSPAALSVADAIRDALEKSRELGRPLEMDAALKADVARAATRAVSQGALSTERALEMGEALGL